jgi:hypothetical protein
MDFMNPEEKKKSQSDFIHNKFTENAFTELLLFARNSRALINVIRLELILHEKTGSDAFLTGLIDPFPSETKQFLSLDALGKIMMLIEGLLVVSDTISDEAKGYRKLAEAMASYKHRTILAFIERFRTKKVDLQRLIGLPEIDKLLITPSEKDEISGAFKEIEKAVEQFLSLIINFYECNLIPYNKFKHGLSLIPGMKLNNSEQQTIASVLTALDKKDKAPSCLAFETKERLMPPELGWFNTMCFVPSPQIEIYEAIITQLNALIPYITNNHLYFAANCGEDYFPVELSDGNFKPRLLLPPGSPYLQGDADRRLTPVILKITKNMNMPILQVSFNLNFSSDKIAKILKSFQDHGSALIWSSESEPGSARVDLTYSTDHKE